MLHDVVIIQCHKFKMMMIHRDFGSSLRQVRNYGKRSSAPTTNREGIVLSSIAKRLKKHSPTIVKRIIHNASSKSQIPDPWFESHYNYAAAIVSKRLKESLNNPNANILDFGCGDGIMSLGVQQKTEFAVTGIDLNPAFEALPKIMEKNIGEKRIPQKLSFLQIEADRSLPFDSNHFDGVFSWSVFEHVREIPVCLNEIYRVLKPEGILFIQIEPLFYSPYGSHLRRLIDEPWPHLLHNETIFLQKVKSAKDNVPEEEKDGVYRQHEFEEVKKFLISEYKTLNRVKTEELLHHVRYAGFHIIKKDVNRLKGFKIPEKLLNQYSKDDLTTNEIQLVLSK